MVIDPSKSGWIAWAKGFKKKKLTETLSLTLKLFKEGKSIKQIAKTRKYEVESIERQIVELITKSFIAVEDVIEKDRIKKILEVGEKVGIESLTKMKEALPKDYSWFEIKCVLAHLTAKPEKL